MCVCVGLYRITESSAATCTLPTVVGFVRLWVDTAGGIFSLQAGKGGLVREKVGVQGAHRPNHVGIASIGQRWTKTAKNGREACLRPHSV